MMNTNTHHKAPRHILLTLVCVLALLAWTTGCTQNEDSNDKSNAPVGNNDTDNNRNALLTGQVADDDQNQEGSLEGMVATVVRIESDGSLTVVSPEPVQVNEEGRYTVAVDMSLAAKADLMVQLHDAEGQQEGQALVSDEPSPGLTITVAPITIESSVEADVYVEARQSEAFEEEEPNDAQESTLRTMITAELAAAVEASEDREGEIKTLAQASVAAMIAWEGMLREQSMGTTEAEIEAAAQAQAEAQIEHDQQLDQAQEEGEARDAEEAHLSAVLNAWAEAGLEAEEISAALQAAADAFVLYTQEMGEEGSEQAERDSEFFVALAVTATVEANAQAAGTQEEGHDAIVQAGADLMASIEASADSGQEQGEEIEEAWAQYRAEVEAQLTANFDAAQQVAYEATVELIATLEVNFDAALEARQAADDEQEAALETAAAHAELRQSLMATAMLEVLGESFANAQAEATLEIMFSLAAAR